MLADALYCHYFLIASPMRRTVPKPGPTAQSFIPWALTAQPATESHIRIELQR